jgi:hypothetical protein
MKWQYVIPVNAEPPGGARGAVGFCENETNVTDVWGSFLNLMRASRDGFNMPLRPRMQPARRAVGESF